MPTAAPCAEPASRRARRGPGDAEVLAALGVGGLLVACALSPAGIEDGPVVCPFRLATGLPCPGCGLTRSWVYLAHGRWGDSVVAHPFGVVLVAFVLGLAAYVVRARVTRRPAPRLEAVVRHPLARVVLVAWLGFALVRLVLAV